MATSIIGGKVVETKKYTHLLLNIFQPAAEMPKQTMQKPAINAYWSTQFSCRLRMV
jgi:hypothetical protein